MIRTAAQTGSTVAIAAMTAAIRASKAHAPTTAAAISMAPPSIACLVAANSSAPVSAISVRTNWAI